MNIGFPALRVEIRDDAHRVRLAGAIIGSGRQREQLVEGLERRRRRLRGRHAWRDATDRQASRQAAAGVPLDHLERREGALDTAVGILNEQAAAGGGGE